MFVMWLTLLNTDMPLLQWGVVIAGSVAAAAWDTRAHRIPNFLTGPLLLGGFVWAIYVGGGSGLLDSVIGCLIMASPYVLLFVIAGGGAGDAKMMGAIGAWLGIVNGLVTLVGVSIAAVILGILFLIYRRGFSSVGPAANAGMLKLLGYLFSARGAVKEESRKIPESESLAKMPYGLAIFTGVSVAALSMWLWRM